MQIQRRVCLWVLDWRKKWYQQRKEGFLFYMRKNTDAEWEKRQGHWRPFSTSPQIWRDRWWKNKTRTNVCQSLVWALLTFSLAFKKLPKVEETYARSSWSRHFKWPLVLGFLELFHSFLISLWPNSVTGKISWSKMKSGDFFQNFSTACSPYMNLSFHFLPLIQIRVAV